jgi:hypothetical protein
MQSGRMFLVAVSTILAGAIAILLVSACGMSQWPKASAPPPLTIPPQVDAFEPRSLPAGQTTVVKFSGKFLPGVRVTASGACKVRYTTQSAHELVAEVSTKAVTVSKPCDITLHSPDAPKLRATVSLIVNPK